MPGLLGLFNGTYQPGDLQSGVSGPSGQEMRFRQGAYNALSQQAGPQDAAILMGNPQAYGLGFQRQLFLNQLQNLIGPDPNNPRMSLPEALYRLSEPGQKEQYGYQPGQPIEPGPGVKIPTYIHGGQPIIGLPGAGPNAGIQGQPSQQPSAAQPQAQGPSPTPPPGMAQMQPYIDWAQRMEAQKAASVKAAEQTATAQPDLPVLQTRSQQLISKLEAIKNNPELSNVVGGPLGIKGRAGPLGQGQSDLINDIQDANNALQGDLFTSLRATSGRGVSPGALKEMRITDLQSGRTGTLEGYKGNIDKAEKQVQEEYEAAWKARGSPDQYKPNWAAAPQQTFPTPTPAHIQALKSQPQRAAEFDSKFGKGAALSVLGR